MKIREYIYIWYFRFSEMNTPTRSGNDRIKNFIIARKLKNSNENQRYENDTTKIKANLNDIRYN